MSYIPIPLTSKAAGMPGGNWETTAENLFECSAKLERENIAMKESVQRLADLDFGARGWDAECESAALRLRAFLAK